MKQPIYGEGLANPIWHLRRRSIIRTSFLPGESHFIICEQCRHWVPWEDDAFLGDWNKGQPSHMNIFSCSQEKKPLKTFVLPFVCPHQFLWYIWHTPLKIGKFCLPMGTHWRCIFFAKLKERTTKSQKPIFMFTRNEIFECLFSPICLDQTLCYIWHALVLENWHSSESIWYRSSIWRQNFSNYDTGGWPTVT